LPPSPEIGSEFPLSEAKIAGPTPTFEEQVDSVLGANLPFAAYGSGREALRALLRDAWELGRRVLALPAYCCDSLVQVADDRFEVVFLPVDSLLSPQPEGILGIANRCGDEAVVVAAPFFGFPLAGTALEALAEAQSLGAWVVEDRSHSLFSPTAWIPAPRGIASLRKWAALPDGGLLYGDGANEATTTDEAGGPFFELRQAAMARKQDWLGDPTFPKDQFLQPLAEAEALLDRWAGLRPMTSLSKERFTALDSGPLVQARRRNYTTLQEGLTDSGVVSPLFGGVGEGICPLGMVVSCKERDLLRDWLRAQQIYCPIHWPLPKQVHPATFAHEHRLSSQLLTLPCDQRYGDADMARIISAILDFRR
jgi:hypothetical protein